MRRTAPCLVSLHALDALRAKSDPMQLQQQLLLPS
jgi:hypothetical protein